MKAEEIIHLLQQGIKPLVKVTKAVEEDECDLDEGMIGRVVNYYPKKDCFIIFDIDISEYLEYNQTLAKKNYYNKEGKACLSFFETPYYTSNIIELFTMYDDVKELVFYNEEVLELFEEYRNSNSSISYVDFLENKIKELKNIQS